MANTMYGIGAGNMLFGTYLDGWVYGPTGYDGIWNAGDGDQSTTEGADKAPDDRFSARSSEVVRGTANDDFYELYRHFTTSVDTYGGDDSVHVYGSGDYNVDTGADDDDLVIATSGEVEANLGSGDDLVRVARVGDHIIEGGSGEDVFQINATLNSPDYKWIVDLAAGTLEQSTYRSNRTNPEVNPTTHFSGFEIFKGSDTDDRFIGTDQRDEVYGRDGDDYLDGQGGNDFFRGGDGDDGMSGGAGDDVFHGDRGDDSFSGQEGSDRAYGGTGNDDLSGGDGNDFLYGHAGDDELWGGYGDDFLQGGSGDDWIIAGAGSDTVYAGDGADRVSAAWGDADAGSDFFDGGAHGHRNGVQTQETANHLSYAGSWKEVFIDNSEGVVSGPGAGYEEFSNGILMHRDTFVNFQSFAGGHGDDTFRASSNGGVDEWFRGNQGDDLFLANAGNEYFNGSHKYIDEDPDGGNDTVDYRHFTGKIDVDLRATKGRHRCLTRCSGATPSPAGNTNTPIATSKTSPGRIRMTASMATTMTTCWRGARASTF